MGCDFRQKHPLFVQIEKTELCHLAKRSKDGSECGRAIVSTSKASTSGCGATTESAPTDQKCEPIAQLNIETIMVHAIKGSAKKYGATSDQCSQFCAAKP